MAATSSGLPMRPSGVVLAILLGELRAAAGHEARLDRARRHRHHAHRRCQRLGQRVADHVEPGLRRDIREVAAHAGEAGDGRDVDHQPVAAGLQHRREGADGGEHAAEVGAQHVVDELVGQRVEVAGGNGLRVARAVDQDVAAAVRGLHLGGGGLQARRVDDVGADRAVALAVRGGQGGGTRGGVVALAVQQHAGGAERGEARGRRVADGAEATGDDGDLAVESGDRIEAHGMKEELGRSGGIGGRGNFISPGSSWKSYSQRGARAVGRQREAADQPPRHAEGRVALQVLVVVGEDLRDQHLVARLAHHEVQVRGPVRDGVVGPQQHAAGAVGRHRVAGRPHAAEVKAALRIGR